MVVHVHQTHNNEIKYQYKYPTMAGQSILVSSEKCSPLQTFFGGLTVSVFVFTWISSLVSPFLLYFSIKTQNYTMATFIIVVTALAYIPFWDTRGAIPRKVKSFIDTFHKMYYTRCKVIFEDSVPSTSAAGSKPTLYAIHPHGAFSLGWSLLFAADYMENVRFCFSPVLYHSPFFKLFAMVAGLPGKADKGSMISYMKRGENLALPPGGFEEATLTSQYQDRAYIKKRVGFVKLCLQHGYPIVPVYCFGENKTFWNAQGFWNLRLKMNSLGAPAILIWGSKFLPILPKRTPNGLLIVAGKRIEIPKIENPTREDVKKWHDKYMAALLKIYEDYKHEAYGDDAKSMKLELW